jgi:hypothetical protein
MCQHQAERHLPTARSLAATASVSQTNITSKPSDLNEEVGHA